jgi:cyclic beta-1,2-glucan synthetase
MINPINHTLDQEGVKRYRTEPYAIAADVYYLDGKVGRGGWSWYTGASGWMYRVWLEDILGLKVLGDMLTVDPVIPPEWDVFHIRYKRGKSLYDIVVENPDNVGRGVVWYELDGQRLPDSIIPIEPVSSSLEIKHNIVVRMGAIPETD